MFAKRRRPQREPTIALINIVFLMLVFFMVAGSLSQPLDPGLALVQTEDLEGRAPPDALVIHADGRLSYRGAALSDLNGYLWEDVPEIARIVPDRNLDARTLVDIARHLRLAGAQKVMIVTERGLE